MIEHGITTSKSSYWLHLFPIEALAFAYVRPKMFQFLYEPEGVHECLLSGCCRSGVEARSPDGSITGKGWVVPRDQSFIGKKQIPAIYLAGKDWVSMTGRQLGMIHGEELALRLINDGAFFRSLSKPFFFVGKSDQLGGRDLSNGTCTIEVKTERPSTGNLFVQTHELGHRVNLRPDGTKDYASIPQRG